MNNEPPIIDMLPDGTFREQPRRPSFTGGFRGGFKGRFPLGGFADANGRPVVPLQAKLMLAAVVVTAVGVSLAVAALAIWVVSMILPVIIIAGAAAYALVKFRRWQSVGSSQQGAVRPNPWQSRGFRE